MNRGGIADLPLLATLLAIRQKFWEPSFWEVMNSFASLAYDTLVVSRALLQQLLASLNFTWNSDFFFLVQTKKSDFYVLPWRCVRLDLVLRMRDIYIDSNMNWLTKFTSSSRTTEFKNILQWNISKLNMKTVPISTRIVISYVMKQVVLLWIWWKVKENWDKNNQNFCIEQKTL